MNTGKIVSLTIPKAESKSVMVIVETDRTDIENDKLYYFEGSRYDTVFVKRENYDNRPELYKIGSQVGVRYTKDDQNRFWAHLEF